MAVSKEGSVALWTRLMDSLYGENTPERRYAEQWDLYPIAHPGAKLRTARLVWSDVKGVGKGAEATVLSYVYGSHNCSLTVNDQQLHSKFNDWLEDKQLIVVPEANLNTKALTERMKDFITNPVAHFEGKYAKGYDGPTCANYLLHSNNADAIRIATGDRRYHVHQIIGDGLKFEKAFWLKLLGPIENPGGWAKANAGALRYHAEHLDYSGFDPFALAPETEAKLSMIEDTSSPLENWVARLKSDPQGLLSGRAYLQGPFRMATTEALKFAYGGDTNTNLFIKTLREAGITKVVPTDLGGGNGGRNQLRIGNRPHTVWALEPGIKMTSDEIRRAYHPLTRLENERGTGWAARPLSKLEGWTK
jgi:Family of unknown function (DUF5906)